MVLINLPRGCIECFAQVSCFANNFSHHAAGFHDAYCAECHMRHADTASGHKKIFYVPRIKAAVRYGRRRVTIKTRLSAIAVKRIIGKRGEIPRFLVMEIDGPCGYHKAVRKQRRGLNVLLGKDMVSYQAARFPSSAHISHPRKPPVRIQFLHILQERPITIDSAKKRIPYILSFSQLVLVKPSFPSPVPRGTLEERVIGTHIKLKGPWAYRKTDRFPPIIRVPTVRLAHVHTVRDTWGKLLSKYRASLPSHHKFSPCQKTEIAVTAAIRKNP